MNSLSVHQLSNLSCEQNPVDERHTNGSALDHVADGKSLDRFVLWCASRAIGASDGLDVAAAFLVTSAGEVVSMQFYSSSLRVSYLDARFLTMIAVDGRKDFCGGWQKSVSFVKGKSVLWTM